MKNEIVFTISPCGGTGKSFITSALAVALNLQSNRKVLIIDTSAGFSGIDYIFGSDKSAVFDSEDFFNSSCGIDKIIYKSPVKNVDIIPSSVDVTTNYSYKDFSIMINFMSDFYDYIFIDTPSWNAVADLKSSVPKAHAVITALPQPSSLTNCPQITEELLNLGFSDVKLVINRFDKRLFFKNTSFQDMDALIDFCQTQLLGIIPLDKKLSLYSYGEFDLKQIVSVASAIKINNKKSALAAIRRISLRIEGNENIFINF